MQGKKIIIAEASSTIKGVADSLLRQHGYDVVCTSDGLQAWEVIQTERPDLALIGLNLSGISGLELCKQMSHDQIAGGIPSMLMVGAKDNITQDQLVTSGARGHLKKPFSPKDLLGAVSRLIGSGDEETATILNKSNSGTRTSYNAEVLSTTRHLEKEPEQVHNLNWVDIEDSKNLSSDAPQKIGSLDMENDDQGLVIEEDQFGLASGGFINESSQQKEEIPSDDEDYDWFIGEMKREVEGGGQKPDSSRKSDSGGHPRKPAVAPDDSLTFVDLGGQDANQQTKTAKSGQSRPDFQDSAKAGDVISEADLERIAEKVAQKLAKTLISNIDRKMLSDTIRSILKK